MLAPLALTVPWIMRGPALVGQAPRNLRWSADSGTLRFSWAKPDGKTEPRFQDYTVRRDGTGLAPAPPETRAERLARLERTGERAVYAEGTDVFVQDDQRTEARRIGQGSAPVLIEEGKAVAFQRDGAIYRFELEGGKTVQVSRLALPENPSQRALSEETARLLKGFDAPKPAGVGISVPEGFRPGPLTVSPSGAFATLELDAALPSGRVAEVPTYITRSGYTETIPTYPKVGDVRVDERVVLVDLRTGKALPWTPPRKANIGFVRWSTDGRYAALWANSADHKDAWLVAFDTKTSVVKTAWREHDDAWVGGPGRGLLLWTPDGRVAFETERDGYANLWTTSPDGTDAKPLVRGGFEVSDVTLDRPRSRLLFVSSEGSPFKRHVDAVTPDGKVSRLAELSADEDATYAVAPDGTLAVVRSSPARPAELWIGDRQVTKTPTDEWLAYPWIEAPIVMVPARDGARIPAKLYKPKDWKRGGPAVLFVHGAGYLQNVYEGWSHYYRETMFNQLLMAKGYAVLDLDFRASAGYGKAWRTAIYRHMGGKDLDDNVDGARWLVSTLGVDPRRIGLYGGSYGGFLTLMAMFNAPEVFAAGAALRPVCDWRNYNHGYTASILNDPQDDPEAYRLSSPIEYAQGLRGELLICHGMVDTNVHFQDSVRLAERLIELGKTGWSLAPYPVEDHAFARPESWTDEYARILALFERAIGARWRKG